jgi:hypothetical protein
VRRNIDTHPVTELPSDGPEEFPPLEGEWSDEVRRWYATWGRSPQAARFLPTDWQRLQMIAPLVDRWYTKLDMRALGELRINESLLGALPGDRARNRQKVAEPKASQAPQPSTRGPLKLVDPKVG